MKRTILRKTEVLERITICSAERVDKYRSRFRFWILRKRLESVSMALQDGGQSSKRLAEFLEMALLQCPIGFQRRLLNVKIQGSKTICATFVFYFYYCSPERGFYFLLYKYLDLLHNWCMFECWTHICTNLDYFYLSLSKFQHKTENNETLTSWVRFKSDSKVNLCRSKVFAQIKAVTCFLQVKVCSYVWDFMFNVYMYADSLQTVWCFYHLLGSLIIFFFSFPLFFLLNRNWGCWYLPMAKSDRLSTICTNVWR